MTTLLPGGVPRLVRLSDFVRHHARAMPEREAIVFGDIRFTYPAFDRAIDACAGALRAWGVKPGDRVAMLTTPRPEFATVLLAAQRIGAIWVGLNPRYRLAEMEYILGDCDPAIFLAIARDADGRRYADDIAAIRASRAAMPIIEIGAAADCAGLPFERFLLRGSDFYPRDQPPCSPDYPAVIVYTSGTTGRPKGALLAHRNLLYSYKSVSRSFAGKEALRDDMRLLCNLPPNHIGCISEMLGNTIIRGGTTIFEERFDPRSMLATIARERITLIGGVPVMLQILLDHPDFPKSDISSLRMIGWGGAPAPRRLVERMQATGAHLFTNYGLTEGGAVVSATPPGADIEALSETVGLPEADGRQKLVDGNGRQVPRGEAGEIWLRGDGVFLGYWNNPDATREAMTPDGWLKTGDMAREHPDGAWVLTGRRAEMFKSGGYNVYPREIELAIEELPAVAVAAVVAAKDADYFEIGAAFIVSRPDASLAEEDVRAHLKQRLANYKIPKLIVLCETLPMLPIGKVDKQALRQRAAALWDNARRDKAAAPQ